MTVTFAVFISVVLDKFLDNPANVCVVEWKGNELEGVGPRECWIGIVHSGMWVENLSF